MAPPSSGVANRPGKAENSKARSFVSKPSPLSSSSTRCSAVESATLPVARGDAAMSCSRSSSSDEVIPSERSERGICRLLQIPRVARDGSVSRCHRQLRFPQQLPYAIEIRFAQRLERRPRLTPLETDAIHRRLDPRGSQLADDDLRERSETRLQRVGGRGVLAHRRVV